MEAPSPKDLSHHYSKVVKRTQPSAIKKFYKYFSIPGIGNLAGGLPNPKYFPYDTLEAHVARPDRFEPTDNIPVKPGPPTDHVGKHRVHTGSPHIVVPHDSNEPDRDKKIDLATALQYGTSQGYPPLRLWIREFARTKMHPNIPYDGGAEVCLTCGSTDGFSKALNVFTNTWDDQQDWLRDRQGVLCEEFAYMNAIQAIRPRGLNVVPVAIDGQGMLAEGPGGLRDVLENWDRSKGKIPHLMYTVTIGQNPTSGTLSVKRRRQIYALCQKFDILIVEDDPYWFLQFPSANKLSAKYRGKADVEEASEDVAKPMGKSSGSPFLDSLVPSYLSIDVDGRVIRLDTFSKTIAPGCRLGWITAQPDIINHILAFTDFTTSQPSGFVQSLVSELVLSQPQSSLTKRNASTNQERKWQSDGWIRWLEGLRGNYERRMQIMSQIMEEGKYQINTQPTQASPASPRASLDGFEVVTRKQLFDFDFPTAGMFMWLRVNYENHPLFKHPRTPMDRLSLAFWIFLTTEKYRVLVAPGSMFCPSDKIRDEKGWFYLRICFAAVNDQVLASTSHSFVQAANDFFDIDDPRDIDDILRDDEDSVQGAVSQLETEMERISLLCPAAF